MARQLEKIEMRVRPVDTYEQANDCDTFVCATCGKTVEPGHGYVVINKQPYHMDSACIPESAAGLYKDLRSEMIDSVKGAKLDQFEALARSLEPHYRGGARLDREQITNLIREELAAKPAHEIIVKRHDKPAVTTNVQGQHHKFGVLMERLALGHSCWLGGPAGTGKTTAAINAAKALGINYYVQTPVSQGYDLFGYQDANGVYHPTALYLWANDPGSLLIWDEIDSFSAKALVAAHPAMENGHLMFPGGRVVDIPEENSQVATANTWGFGANADYSARVASDGATSDRFRAFIQWEIDEDFELSLVRDRVVGGEYGTATFEHALAKAWHTQCLRIRQNLSDFGIKLIWSPRQTLGVIEGLLGKCAKHGDFKHLNSAWKKSVEEVLQVSALARLPKEQFDKAVTNAAFMRPCEATSEYAEAVVKAYEEDAENAGSPF